MLTVPLIPLKTKSNNFIKKAILISACFVVEQILIPLDKLSYKWH
jgi:hypothetical protein